MDDLAKHFPDDLEWSVHYDTTRFIKESTREVIITLVEAILLVIFVVYIFLQNFRSTLIPTIAIPVSLIGTFVFMLAFGFSINTLTLLGLVVAVALAGLLLRPESGEKNRVFRAFNTGFDKLSNGYASVRIDTHRFRAG